jgi:hypothetical protein
MAHPRKAAWRMRLRWHRQRLRRIVASLDSPILMVDLPGNVGDQLIWSGIDAALDDLFVDRVPVAHVDATSGHTLVVPGSGAWSSKYDEWLPDLVASASGRFATVLVLPSSFDVRVPAVRRALSPSNVIPLARERVSAAAVSAFRTCALTLDCSVYAPLNPSPGPAPTTPRGELVCLRTDSESAIPRDHYELSDANDDISATAPDLRAWLTAIQASSCVTTDRAHVMIAATLMGKPVRYLEGSYWKVHALADYTFGPMFAHRLEPITLGELARESKVVERSSSDAVDRAPYGEATQGER